MKICYWRMSGWLLAVSLCDLLSACGHHAPARPLVKVEAQGPGVCHEGYQSCFFRRLENGEWKVSEERTYDPDAVYKS